VNAATEAKRCSAPEGLTLSHVDSFVKEMAEAGIVTDQVSPKLLPDYARKV